MNALRKIEEQHKKYQYRGDHCERCNGDGYPCDVVKLARALDAIRTGSTDPNAAATAMRVLKEVVGE